MKERSQGDGSARSRRGSALLKFLPSELFHAFNREQLRSWGALAVLAACLASLAVWVAQGSTSLSSALTVMAKSSAFLAITLLSVNFVLSTRARFLEEAFGGLDRMYKVHKLVGKAALLFAILHPTFLVMRRLGEWELVAEYLVPGLSWPFTLGLLSTLLMLVLIGLTVQAKLPYHVWKRTHRLFVAALLLAMAHALLSGSDIAKYPVLGYWVAGMSLVGVACFVYTVHFYRYLGPRTRGQVVAARRMGNITELTVRTEKALPFHPGQFVFLRFLRFAEVRESFPFSLSNDPSEGVIRISAKRSGDFTSGPLTTSEVGDAVEVMGPYGKFGERYLVHRSDMVWIAGGIGITPFLSMAKHEAKSPVGRKVHLVWVYSDPSDAAYESEVRAETLNNPCFTFTHWNSRSMGRIDGKQLAGLVDGIEEIRRRTIFICGPPALMRSMFDQLVELGVPRRRIFYEDFDLLG